jgi:phosphoglycolate phosphatase-like HAD superfamily hydrolase
MVVTLGPVTLAVFDIDGVVADVRHRLHHLLPPKSWVAFFDEAHLDGLLTEGARLVADLARRHEIVWLTGRPEWLRDTTTEWLAQHGLPGSEVHLRPNHDRRPAPRFKLEVLRQLAPRGVAAFIDDDSEVIDAAVAAGFPAVLADWLPRDQTLRDAQDRLGRT